MKIPDIKTKHKIRDTAQKEINQFYKEQRKLEHIRCVQQKRQTYHKLKEQKRLEQTESMKASDERSYWLDKELFLLERVHKKLCPKKKIKYYTIPFNRHVSIKTKQRVYEDNIKQYGTLTCYLCNKEIVFGDDEIEHKMPVSRGGSSKYNNLAIACKKCNMEKRALTVDEYKTRKIQS